MGGFFGGRLRWCRWLGGVLFVVFAYRGQWALLAVGFAGLAHVAAVKYKPMVGNGYLGSGYVGYQLAFGLQRIFGVDG